MNQLDRFKKAGELFVDYLFVAPILTVLPNQQDISVIVGELEEGLRTVERELGIRVLDDAVSRSRELVPSLPRDTSAVADWLDEISTEIYFECINRVEREHGREAAEAFLIASWIRFAELVNAVKNRTNKRLDALLTAALWEAESRLTKDYAHLDIRDRIKANRRAFDRQMIDRSHVSAPQRSAEAYDVQQVRPQLAGTKDRGIGADYANRNDPTVVAVLEWFENYLNPKFDKHDADAQKRHEEIMQDNVALKKKISELSNQLEGAHSEVRVLKRWKMICAVLGIPTAVIALIKIYEWICHAA